MWHVDHHTTQCDTRRDVVLIGIRSDHPNAFSFLGGLEHTEPSCVGVLEDHVGAAPNLRECLFFPRARVIPVSNEGGDDFDFRIDRARARCERREAGLHRR